MMGRPTKLTAKLQEDLLGMLAAGVPTRWACEAAGISPGTFYGWRGIGEEWEDAPARGKGKVPPEFAPYVEFLHASRAATARGKATPVLELVGLARNPGTKEEVRARILMFLLTHGDREHWHPSGAAPAATVADETEIELAWD